MNGGMKRNLKMVKRQTCQRQSRNASVMSMVVVGKFLCFYTLPTILDLCERIMDTEQFDSLPIWVNLSNAFVVLNSSCNFFIYFLFGQSFRQCFYKFFHQCADRLVFWRKFGNERRVSLF